MGMGDSEWPHEWVGENEHALSYLHLLLFMGHIPICGFSRFRPGPLQVLSNQIDKDTGSVVIGTWGFKWPEVVCWATFGSRFGLILDIFWVHEQYIIICTFKISIRYINEHAHTHTYIYYTHIGRGIYIYIHSNILCKCCFFSWGSAGCNDPVAGRRRGGFAGAQFTSRGWDQAAKVLGDGEVMECHGDNHC